jgi:hypothetical protein
MEGTERRIKRRNQVLGDTKLTIGYWKSKAEAPDNTACIIRFGRGYGPVAIIRFGRGYGPVARQIT